MTDRDDLADAFEHFLTRLREAEASVRSFDAFGDDDAQRARGYQHLARMVLKSIERDLLQDPDHPHFRVLDDRVREGGDNPDQRYAIASVRGGVPYRLRGRLGSAARVEVQLYSEEPYGGKNVGVGYLPHESIDFDADGAFTVDLAPGASGRSALDNPSTTSIVQVRQIYDDWTDDDPGEVFIDRVDMSGDRKTVDTAAEVAAAFRAAGDTAYHSTERWPALVQNGVVKWMEKNTLPPLMSPGDRAGVVGRWIAIGHFDLDPETALVVSVSPVGADYQGAQLSDLWFSSLEYANATGSISGAQSVPGPDGKVHLVVAMNDPGYVNWLDTGGLRRGTVHLRFDGVDGEIPSELWPTAELVRLDDLAEAIPGFADDQVTTEQRADQRRARRRHVQKRYNH